MSKIMYILNMYKYIILVMCLKTVKHLSPVHLRSRLPLLAIMK